MVNKSNVDLASSPINAIDGNPMTSYKVSSSGINWLIIELFWLYQVKNITALFPGSLTSKQNIEKFQLSIFNVLIR